jgi:hypothetical protein
MSMRFVFVVEQLINPLEAWRLLLTSAASACVATLIWVVLFVVVPP